ncbi:MAG: hypothetical protein HGA44_15790 [Cellulomonadaceae bacterium]|nr:hypothetical protein [Cellulomonadaceae bacterium]
MPSADDEALSGIEGSSSTGSSYAASDEPWVYYGERTIKIGGSARPGVGIWRPDAPVGQLPGRGGSTRKETQKKSLSEALSEFYSWTDEERFKWGDYLVSLGLLDAESAHDFTTLKEAWTESVQEAANYYTLGKRKVTPWETAKILASESKAAKAKGPHSEVTTGTSVDLTNPTEAKALVNDALARALGRAATREELDTFRGVLNAAEKANPVTTTQTTNYDAEGDATSGSSTSTGGVDRNQVLLDQAMKKPEYGAYQAATTYMSALLSAVQSPVNA